MEEFGKPGIPLKNTGFDGFKAYNNFSVACILYGEGFIKNYDEYEKIFKFCTCTCNFYSTFQTFKIVIEIYSVM